MMDLHFEGPVISWRGPSPYHFVPVPADDCEVLRDLATMASYGWGVVPVRVRIGDTDFRTSLFPKDGGYLVPVKDAVRRAEALSVGDLVSVGLSVGR